MEPGTKLLRQGPCADVFEQLEACKADKNLKQHANALTFCVNETDRLIRCFKKHPAHFQSRHKDK